MKVAPQQYARSIYHLQETALFSDFHELFEFFSGVL
jgi:hypothetical protein